MFELRITMDQMGKVNVEGPCNNRALCEAMMAGAKVVLEDYDRKRREQVVSQAPVGIDLARLRNGGG